MNSLSINNVNFSSPYFSGRNVHHSGEFDSKPAKPLDADEFRRADSYFDLNCDCDDAIDADTYKEEQPQLSLTQDKRDALAAMAVDIYSDISAEELKQTLTGEERRVLADIAKEYCLTHQIAGCNIDDADIESDYDRQQAEETADEHMAEMKAKYMRAYNIWHTMKSTRTEKIREAALAHLNAFLSLVGIKSKDLL